MYVHRYMGKYTCMYANVYVYMRECICVCVCLCVHMSMSMRKHMKTYVCECRWV